MRSRRRLPVLVGTLGLVLALPGGLSAQADFQATISPNPVTLTAGGSAVTVSVATIPIGSFDVPVTYSFTGFPPGISTGGSQTASPTPSGMGILYPPVSFSFTAGAAVAPGTYAGTLVGSLPDFSKSFPMTVQVVAPAPPPPPPTPDFSLSVAPGSVEIAPGGSSSILVGIESRGGFDEIVTATAPSLSGISFVPAVFYLAPGESRSVSVAADAAAAGTSSTAVFRATAPSLPGERTAPLTIRVTGTTAPPPPPPPPPPTPNPDFALAVTPTALVLAGGESAVVNVAAVGLHNFDGTIAIEVSGPLSLSVAPSVFSLTAGAAQAIVVTAEPSAAAGPTTVVFTGITSGAVGSRTATLMVDLRPRPPSILSITPPAIVTGTTQNTLRITGQNFDPQAIVVSESPGIEVISTRVVGPTAADVLVSARPDAPPGPYRLDLRNPDGGVAPGGAMLLVYPAGSLGAPLAVTAALIVYPRPWQLVEVEEPLYARALIATSGMGTIVGTWLLDGVPFDRFTRVVSGGFPTEIRSNAPIPISFTGEHRLELLIESPPSLPPESVPFLLVVESRSRLRILAPDAGAVLDPEAPVFRWTLVPGASGYEIEIEDVLESIEERPRIVLRRRTTDTEWRPGEELLRTLGPGIKRFLVRSVFPGEVEGEATAWRRFMLSPHDPATEPETEGASRSQGASFRFASLAVPAGQEQPPRALQDPIATQGQIGATLLNTTSAIASEFEDPPNLTRLQLSTQTDVRHGAFEQQATADLSASQEIQDPWHAREESRNWMTRAGFAEGRWQQETMLGFAPPSFFDQSEFLTAGFSSGAIQGTVGSPGGRFSYYHSLDLSSGRDFGPRPNIEAAAYEASDSADRFLFRTMALRVTDPEVAGFWAGGEGTALGVIGVADLGPRLRLLAEAAGGGFEPGEGSFEEERDGRAFRVSASGSAGTLGYGGLFGYTGSGFVNPANRGFTPGGVSDRMRTEVSLQKLFGRTTLGGQYRHLRGGISAGAGHPETTQNDAGVTLSVPIGQKLSLSAAGNLAVQRGDADAATGLPRTDRTQKGLGATFSERLGPFSLSQAITWQDFSDDVFPYYDQRVTAASLAASGALGSAVSLSANLSSTTTRGAPEVGRTDQILLTVQPSLRLVRLWLNLTPRAAWSRMDNEVQDQEFKSDQYQVVVRWTPPWAGALLNFEVSSDWSRSWSGPTDPPSFNRKTVLTLTLNWRGDRAWRSTAPTATTGTPQNRT